ncbi:MAG: hypothetical protein KF773_21760 [Deltaproteobacteria bacterium]|nr:hypothetical protein [Deltaproteobacteria bacterium]MCW5802708.1 hypothetical protein [Deltaproteobacteria bacterium]
MSYADEYLARELAEQGRATPVPPWVRYPDIERFSIGWRMGSGEGYLHLWGGWTGTRTHDELLAYLREFAPIPADFADWAGGLLLPEPCDAHGNPLDWEEAMDAQADHARALGLVAPA